MRDWLGPLLQLTLARLREQRRQPEVLFWVFAFPLLLAVVLGLAFRNRPADTVRVAIASGPGADSLAGALDRRGGFHVVVLPEDSADEQLRTGGAAVVVEPLDPLVYRYDPARSESRVARLATDDAL